MPRVKNVVAALVLATRRNLVELRLQMRYIRPPMTCWPFITVSGWAEKGLSEGTT